MAINEDSVFDWEVDHDHQTVFIRIKGEDGAMSLRFGVISAARLADQLMQAAKDVVDGDNRG